MKYLVIACIAAASLGGCAIVPMGYGEHHDGYDENRSYGRGYGDGRDYGRNDDNRAGPYHYQGS